MKNKITAEFDTIHFIILNNMIKIKNPIASNALGKMCNCYFSSFFFLLLSSFFILISSCNQPADESEKIQIFSSFRPVRKLFLGWCCDSAATDPRAVASRRSLSGEPDRPGVKQSGKSCGRNEVWDAATVNRKVE